ncbi:MAG: hypothetical protein SZ59_C0002G0261 [candidate division TM6 bacterium GW2011_GWF2_28_16]|nr:MAG: hypothetical protein SZ59_C0002G0261 [candidate division TM6 bacterium GW2011_GWF2_28_16]
MSKKKNKSIEDNSLEKRLRDIELIKNKEFVCDDVNKLIEYVLDGFYREEKSSIELFKALIEGINSNDWSIKYSAQELFKVLLEKLIILVKEGDAFYEQAAQAAEAGMESGFGVIIDLSLELFKALVEKGQAFEQATKAADKGMRYNYSHIVDFSVALFKRLLEKDQGLARAISVAIEVMRSNDREIKNLASNLFDRSCEKLTKCVEKVYKHEFDKILNIVEQELQKDDVFYKKHAIKLVTLLVKQKQTFELALEIVKQEIKSDDLGYVNDVMDLLIELVAQGYEPSFELALNIANERINSTDEEEQVISLGIFIELVRNSYQKAIRPAYKTLKKHMLNYIDNMNAKGSSRIEYLFIGLLFFAFSNSEDEYNSKLENKLLNILVNGINIGEGQDFEIIDISNLVLANISFLNEKELNQNIAAIKLIINVVRNNFDLNDPDGNDLNEYVIKKIEERLPVFSEDLYAFKF